MQGCLEDEAYAHVGEVLAAAAAAAESRRAMRNPLPRLVRCDQGTSQARFLIARLNPSMTQENSNHAEAGTVVYTDDVSFAAFYDQLRSLAVN